MQPSEAAELFHKPGRASIRRCMEGRMDDRTDIDLLAVKQTLEMQRATLQRESVATAENRQPVALDQQSVGRLSRMDALQMQAMAQAQERRRRLNLQKIEAALKRLEAGDYGYCVACGEEIAAKRLAVDGTVARCIDCAN